MKKTKKTIADHEGSGTDGARWYQKYISDPEWHKFFEREARNKLRDLVPDWENCWAEAMERLFYKKLPDAKLAHDDNHDGLVATTYRRILIDLLREERGRPRMPTAMKNAGPPIDRIFSLFCFEGRSKQEIIEELQLTSSIVGHWTSWLVHKNKCKGRPSEVSIDGLPGGGENVLPGASGKDDSPVEESQTNLELKVLLSMCLDPDDIDSTIAQGMTQKARESVEAIHDNLKLTDDERLVLRLLFVEGLSVSKASQAIKLSSSKTKSVKETALEKIKKVLGDSGFGL